MENLRGDIDACKNANVMGYEIRRKDSSRNASNHRDNQWQKFRHYKPPIGR